MQGTLLVCFDINSIQEENSKNNDNSEDLMENPIGLINNFFSNHKISKMEKTQTKPSEMKYDFVLNLPDDALFHIISINDLSFIHEVSLDADGYLIFINLEDIKTIDKLEYLLKYILESCCSVEIKTYIVGLYKEKIIKECKKEELENLFNDHNLSYDYYQIKYTDDLHKHFCLYEFIDNKNYNDKNFFRKKTDDYHLFEIMEKILSDIYGYKMGFEFDPFKRKFVEKSVKGLNGDRSGDCNIF